MRPNSRSFALTALFLTATLASAQEAYTLKVSKPEHVGDRVRHEMEDKLTNMITVKDASGKALKDDTETTHIVGTFDEKILEKQPGKRATKAALTFEKAVLFEQGKEVEAELTGKTVIAELKDKTYRFTFENGGEVTGAGAKFLAALHRDKGKDDDNSDERIERVLLPAKAVKVGETWKCDTAAVIKDFLKDAVFAIDENKAAAGGKLLKAYRKDGRQFGVIDLAITLPVKSLGNGNQKIAMDAGAALTINFTMDVCIDGSAEAGTMTAKMGLKGNGKLSSPDGGELTVNMNVSGEMKNSRQPLK